MPVPSSINDLSTTPGSNSPAGTESPSTADDYFRAHAAFIASLRDTKVGLTGNETIAGNKTFSGSATFSNPISGSTTTQVSKTSSTGSGITPTGTSAQRDGTPLAGYFRFNTTLGKFEGYNGSVWGAVGGGATGGGDDEVFIENGKTVSVNYTIPGTKNAMTTGPVTINSGVTVTVSSGARWVIL